MYLEGKRKLHRDISYTNILLREPEDDLVQKEARKQFMMLLGLSEIEELREELRCREGLLIDFDYGAALADLETQMAEPENAERDLEDGEIERAEEDDEEDENEQQEEADWVVPEGTQSTGEVVQDSHVTHALKAPGARTVRFPNLMTIFHVLRNHAGDCSFHRD
jgi:serine/threonine protein kinase